MQLRAYECDVCGSDTPCYVVVVDTEHSDITLDLSCMNENGNQAEWRELPVSECIDQLVRLEEMHNEE